MKFLMSLLVPLLLMCQCVTAMTTFDTSAKQALLVDFETGAVLFEKNADEQMTPSSMTKIMTVYLIFEALENKKLFLQDKFLVSKKAWKMEGSRMFLEVGKRVSIEELLRGAIVLSGNDACVTIAEGIAGTEENFAQLMNEKARELGVRNTKFQNATGLPEKEHFSTARDLVMIAVRTIKDYPHAYSIYYSQREFTHNSIRQANRNPLLARGLGDGLKTGETVAGGHGLVGSGTRGGRRLIFVINGLPDKKSRAREAERIINWGFRGYDNQLLFKAGEVIVNAPVWDGEKTSIPLISEKNVMITVRRGDEDKPVHTVRYRDTLSAPLKKGEMCGELVVTTKIGTQIFPLVAQQDMARAGFIKGLWYRMLRFIGLL